MSCTLFVHASPHGAAAQGYRLATEIGERIARYESNATRIERNLTAPALPPIDADYAQAVTGNASHDDARFRVSEQLIGELERSDRLIITLPMHNFTVPAAFKLWVDYVVRINRSFAATAEGKVGLLADRPTTILVSSGGVHRGQDAFQPDFLSPYLRQVLATIGITDIGFHYLQGLTAGQSRRVTALDAARGQLRTNGLLD
ncbi:NAD(P)H dehydrogenase (quinone) [Salinisphaera sp. S4-8]|uniref:FMN-dependent NADH-azoreductase n=1 Tax=Salinisphaera sp. S4-8 TaxID=633357 RepID=UPI003342379D